MTIGYEMTPEYLNRVPLSVLQKRRLSAEQYLRGVHANIDTFTRLQHDYEEYLANLDAAIVKKTSSGSQPLGKLQS